VRINVSSMTDRSPGTSLAAEGASLVAAVAASVSVATEAVERHITA
jgi:hypothetical protein